MSQQAIQSIPREIVLVEEARAYLAECQSLDEVKMIRDKAEALRLYMRKRDASIDVINDAAEIKIQAEWRMGKLIPESGIHPGGNQAKLHAATLSGLGIEKTESFRCQSIAGIPEKTLDHFIREIKEARKELTTASVLRLARSLQREDDEEEPSWSLYEELGRLRTMLHRFVQDCPQEKRGVVATRIIELGQELFDTGEIFE